MKTKFILLLVSLLLAGGTAAAKSRALKGYRSWPMGLSVSVVMPSEKLQQVKDAGFDWVEVTLNSQRTTSAEERHAAIERFRAEAQRIGLKVWSVHLPFGRDWDVSNPDEAKRSTCIAEFAWFIDAVKVLSPRKLVLHPSWEPIADEDRCAHIEACIRSFNDLAPTANKAGMQLLVEDLPRTCLGNTSQEMLAILNKIDPSVGVCFDTNHLLKETPQAFAKSIGKRIASLHVSDYDAVDEKHWIMGRGIIDWPVLIGAISATGYDGIFLFEVGGYDSFTQIADTWRSVEKQLEAATE